MPNGESPELKPIHSPDNKEAASESSQGKAEYATAELDRRVKTIATRMVQDDIKEEIHSIAFESFSGPLPHPRIAKGWAELVPDSPERFLRMAEIEQAHRHSMESRQITVLEKIARSEAYAITRGQLYALILFGSALTAGIVLAVKGFTAVSIFIFLGSVISGGIYFLVDRKKGETHRNNGENDRENTKGEAKE